MKWIEYGVFFDGCCICVISPILYFRNKKLLRIAWLVYTYCCCIYRVGQINWENEHIFLNSHISDKQMPQRFQTWTCMHTFILHKCTRSDHHQLLGPPQSLKRAPDRLRRNNLRCSPNGSLKTGDADMRVIIDPFPNHAEQPEVVGR